MSYIRNEAQDTWLAFAFGPYWLQLSSQIPCYSEENMMFSRRCSCWSHSHFILAQLISCVYWNSNSGPMPHSSVQEVREFLQTYLPFPTRFCILLTWGTLFCCLTPESFTQEHIQPKQVFDLTLVRLFCHAETCITPFPFLVQWKIKLWAIFNQFLVSFILCWFGNEESFLGNGWVGRASKPWCCLRALYAGNKWRLTTPPHQIRDTYRGSSSLPLKASQGKQSGKGREDFL